MKTTRIWIFVGLSIWAVLLISAILSQLYQQSIVNFVSKHGWDKLVGFTSGPWWNSLPAWLISGAAILTFIIGINQLHQARISTKAQIAVSLFKELRSENKIDTLRNLIYAFKEQIPMTEVEEVKTLLNQRERDINIVLDHLDMLGILVKEEVIDERLAIEGYAGATVLRCWYQLHNYVIWERYHKRGYNAYEHLEDLANRVLKYAKKHKKNPYWISFTPGHEGRTIDLVAMITDTQDIYLKPQPLGKQHRPMRN